MGTPLNTDSSKKALFEEIKPYILDLIQKAPKYGSCRVDIVFHDGRPAKITTTVGVTLRLTETPSSIG
jgi:hypothetical protein